MAKSEHEEGVFKRLRPHAEWEIIRAVYQWGSPVIWPIGGILYQKIRHADRDWLAIGLLFIFGLVSSFIGFILNRTRTKKAAISEIEAPAQAEHDLSSLVPDGRLKIISAHYGVDGGANADVAEKYLRPKVCGHSLAGWVGADLFGGFQPVIGLTKRVKVRYSFDGTEGAVSRKEHELLVLPDPSLVEPPRIVVTGLEDGDPRIMPSFVDGRKYPIPTLVSFELKNCGNRDALWVRMSLSNSKSA